MKMGAARGQPAALPASSMGSDRFDRERAAKRGTPQGQRGAALCSYGASGTFEPKLGA